MSARVLMVVPTLGRRIGFLRKTFISIAHQKPAVDVVVVVPGDATEARSLAREFGAGLVDDPGSLSGAINLGWKSAGAGHDYLAWLGDDDLLLPGSVGTAVAALDADPVAAVAFGACEYITVDDRIIWTSRAGRFAPWLMTWGPDLVPQPGSLFRREAVLQAGPVDEALAYAMDLDLLLRLRRVGRFVDAKTVLAQFRWHPDSLTVSGRTRSLQESEEVKRRYYSPAAARSAVIWERPVRAATRLAAYRLNRRARRT